MLLRILLQVGYILKVIIEEKYLVVVSNVNMLQIMLTTRRRLVFLMFIFTVAAAVPKPEEHDKKDRTFEKVNQ